MIANTPIFNQDPSAAIYGMAIAMLVGGISILLELVGGAIDTFGEALITFFAGILTGFLLNFLAEYLSDFVWQLIAATVAIISYEIFPYAGIGALYDLVKKYSWGDATFVFVGSLVYAAMLIIWGIVFLCTFMNY